MPEENIHLLRFLKLQLFLRLVGPWQRFYQDVVGFLDIDVVVVHYVTDWALFPSDIQGTMTSDGDCVEILSSRRIRRAICLVNIFLGNLAIGSRNLLLPPLEFTLIKFPSLTKFDTWIHACPDIAVDVYLHLLNRSCLSLIFCLSRSRLRGTGPILWFCIIMFYYG